MAAYTINKSYTIEYEIKKSRFITNLIPISSLDECKEALKEIRKKYYDATHNCYSYIIKDNDTDIIKYSDDGEPSKTAGIVIYDVLCKNELVNVLCVVTRYFGGIKLGANGLVRAYSKAASDVINIIEKIKIEKMTNISFYCEYNYINDCMKIMERFKEINKEFTDKAYFTYEIQENLYDDIKNELIKATKGSIKIKE